MSNHEGPRSKVAALVGVWLLLAIVIPANAQNATSPQAQSPLQATAAAVQDFTQFLKEETARDEQLAKRESEALTEALKNFHQETEHALKTIEDTLSFFEWVVTTAGVAVSLAAAVFVFLLKFWGRENKANIDAAVNRQIRGGVIESVESRAREALQAFDRIREMDERYTQFYSRIDFLKEQQELQSSVSKILELSVFSLGKFPYDYLKSIHEKKNAPHPDREEFLMQDGEAFKREMGALIDGGYIENVDLSRFHAHQNILGDLTITKAGERLIELRESLRSKQAQPA